MSINEVSLHKSLNGHYVKSAVCEKCSYLSVFSPNAGKYGPEKNFLLDTFHTVGS